MNGKSMPINQHQRLCPHLVAGLPSPEVPKMTMMIHLCMPAVFAQTVEENKLFYAPREVDRAKQARDLLAALGPPSIADLKAAVAMNAIANLPVTTKD